MSRIQLFHTGYAKIPEPDIHYGRTNADFGQGFYLSDNEEFSKRRARVRKGLTTYINCYELDTAGLNIKSFARDEEWFGCIYNNRAGYPDALAEYDVIVGPIANDTIYDTGGITTSGLLKREQALQLLLIGPLYIQTVIRTEKAAVQLKFISAEELKSEETAVYRDVVRREEDEYQSLFAEKLAVINVCSSGTTHKRNLMDETELNQK